MYCRYEINASSKRLDILNRQSRHFLFLILSEAIVEATLEKNVLHPVDYVVLVLLLLVSAGIGVYFMVQDKRKGTLTEQDYLMASRQMTSGKNFVEHCI